MKFTKMQGCGNDYVYINGYDYNIVDPGHVAKIVSDRNFGIGSDGLIIIYPSDKADFRMAMYNADGSEGKMCGNGIRCVGKYVYDNKMTCKDEITVETLSGVKNLKLNIKNGYVDTVQVNMGAPDILASNIPVICNKEQVIDYPVNIEEEKYLITCVSMGNPHAVTFVNNINYIDIESIGPKFENHSMFPDKINTEFVQIINRNNIKMRVWERGSGETKACGTGACASVVAAVLNDLVEDKVNVELLGGRLFIEYYRDENTVYMTGPARTSFTGDIEL